MLSAAIAANPVPYSKVCDTFRPRVRQCAATRTDLGRRRFIDFLEARAMLNSLVRELIAEGRPAGIENGLRHAGLGEPGGIHIAYRDVIELGDDARRELVQKVVPGVDDLGVQVPDETFLVGALRTSQSVLDRADVARVGDLLTSREHRKVLQPQ